MCSYGALCDHDCVSHVLFMCSLCDTNVFSMRSLCGPSVLIMCPVGGPLGVHYMFLMCSLCATMRALCARYVPFTWQLRAPSVLHVPSVSLCVQCVLSM